MSVSDKYAFASTAVRMMAFLIDLERWHALPWYQRLITPKPQLPKES